MTRFLMALFIGAVLTAFATFLPTDLLAAELQKTPLSADDVQTFNQAADATAQTIVAGDMTAGEIAIAALAAVGIIFIVLIVAN